MKCKQGMMESEEVETLEREFFLIYELKDNQGARDVSGLYTGDL